jgi:hypothetical protein
MQKANTVKKRKDEHQGRNDPFAAPKHRQLNQEHRRILEADMGHDERIPITQVKSFTIEELYEKGGNSKNSEVKPGEQIIKKDELHLLSKPVVDGKEFNIEDIFSKRKANIFLDSTVVPPKTLQPKQEHKHSTVEIPLECESVEVSESTGHLNCLQPFQRKELMSSDLYDEIENVFDNLQDVLLKPLRLESFLESMKTKGGVSHIEFRVSKSKYVDIVFPADDYDIYFVCVRFQLDDNNTFHAPKKLIQEKIHRTKALLYGEDEELSSAVRVFLKNATACFVKRFYFHCPCDDI